MNTQEAYINGFVKRASEYGYSEDQAVELLKQSGFYTKAQALNLSPRQIGQVAIARAQMAKDIDNYRLALSHMRDGVAEGTPLRYYRPSPIGPEFLKRMRKFPKLREKLIADLRQPHNQLINSALGPNHGLTPEQVASLSIHQKSRGRLADQTDDSITKALFRQDRMRALGLPNPYLK